MKRARQNPSEIRTCWLVLRMPKGSHFAENGSSLECYLTRPKFWLSWWPSLELCGTSIGCFDLLWASPPSCEVLLIFLPSKHEINLFFFFFFLIVRLMETPVSSMKMAVRRRSCRLSYSLRATGCGLARFPFWGARRGGRTAADVLLSDCQNSKGAALYGRCGDAKFRI